jgi:hypothetical protein
VGGYGVYSTYMEKGFKKTKTKTKPIRIAFNPRLSTPAGNAVRAGAGIRVRSKGEKKKKKKGSW